MTKRVDCLVWFLIGMCWGSFCWWVTHPTPGVDAATGRPAADTPGIDDTNTPISGDVSRSEWPPAFEPNESYRIEFGTPHAPSRSDDYPSYWPIEPMEMPRETRTLYHWETDLETGHRRLVFEE
jgi:hypothetical protein